MFVLCYRKITNVYNNVTLDVFFTGNNAYSLYIILVNYIFFSNQDCIIMH